MFLFITRNTTTNARMQLKVLLYILVIWFPHFETGFAGCSEECSGISTRFNFQNGSSYAFDYQSSATVQLVGNSGKAGAVSLEAIAIISVLDQCEYQLQLFNVKFNGPSAAQVGFDLAQELTEYPLRFAYDNGAVLQICPLPQENNDALNIKRGILSTFQFPNDFHDEEAYESDISGDCPVQIISSMEENDTTLVVGKKNLMTCRNHVQDFSSFRFVPYNVVSKVQNVPNLEASQICIYRVQQEILIEATCVESHDLLAFRSSSGGGISARIESKLSFLLQDNALAAASFGEPESLLFNQQPFIYRESIEAAEKARNLIRLLQDTVDKEVRPESAGHFQELVDTMKTMALKDLKLLAQEAKTVSESDPKAQRIYVDAISQCGTSNCVEVLVQLLNPIKNPNVPKLTPNERRFILVDLALTPHPTKQGVSALTAGLDQLPDQGLFAATSFVNNFIRQNTNGQNSNEVKQFVKTYLEMLSEISASANPTGNNRLIEALRALGNLAKVQEGIDERLAYLNSTTATIDVKLAAIQSLRRAPCVPATEDNLFSMYADQKMSVEIRLNAFLILVRQCTTEKLIHKLAQHASQENKSNQVGAFVQSYFKSNRRSSDSSRDKNYFAWSFLNKIYPTDSDRYSSYSHYSSFDHKKNLGYHADLASIYVPEDAYPRQQFVNLTIDLWGSKVNLLEMGYRIEHLHDFVDYLFGPEGYFINSVWASNRDFRKKENKHPKLAAFQTQFDAKHKLRTGLDFSAYIRLFGDELAHSSVYDLNLMKKFHNFFNWVVNDLPKAMNKENTIGLYVHRLPYDSFKTIPVISGFPLRLSSNGSIVINVDASVKADIKDVQKGKAEIRLKLKPSAAYQASLHMAVYTGSVKNGVRFTRNSHSATSVEFELKTNEIGTLSAKLNLPKVRQEIYSVESNVYTIVNDVPTEELGVQANRGEGNMCMPSLFDQYTGLKLCTSISYPNASNIRESPYFPLTGLFKAEVFVDKDDADLTSYQLTASFVKTLRGSSIKVEFDTPRSVKNRQQLLVINYERQKSVDLTFTSPINVITCKGILQAISPYETGLKFTANISSKVYEYAAKIKAERNITNIYRKYSFYGTVTKPERPQTRSWKGFLEIQHNSKINVNFDLTELYGEPVSLNIRYQKADQKHLFEYENNGLGGPRRLFCNLNIKRLTDMDYKFELEYVEKVSQQTHKITYEHKHLANFSPGNSAFIANSKILSSLYPTSNFAYNLSYQRQSEQFEIKVSTVKGDEPGVSLEVLTKTQYGLYDFTARINPVPGYKASVTLKGQRVRGVVPFTGDATALLSFPDESEYKIAISIKQGESSDNYDMILTADLPQNRKAEIKSSRKGKYDNFISTNTISLPGKSISIDYKMQKSGEALDYNVVVHIDFPNADYKVDYKRRRINYNNAHNLTIFEKNRPLIYMNIGRRLDPNQSNYFDLNVKTFAPLRPRNLTGFLSFERSSQLYKGDLYLTGDEQDKKLLLQFERSERESQKTLKYLVVLGKDTINVTSVRDYGWRNLLLNVSVQSSLPALKNIQYTVKSDQREGLDAGFNLNLNDVLKVDSFYKRSSSYSGDEKYGIGFLAKVGTVYYWEVSSDSLWNNRNGKFEMKNILQISPKSSKKYLVDFGVDTVNMQTKVDLQNIPGMLGTLKGRAKKVGDQKYEISLGDLSGSNKGLFGFKFTATQQNFWFETASFKSSIESEYSTTKFGFGCSLTPDVTKPSKVFALKYASEAPNEFSRSANLEVTYPERTIAIFSKRDKQPNQKVDQLIEWSPNHGKRQPVKLQYSVLKSSDSNSDYEFHLNDPLTLPDGFHLFLNQTKNGTLDDDNIYYSQKTEITLKYSDDPQRHLIIKKERGHKIVGRFSQFDKSLLVQHGATNLNHRMYSANFVQRHCEWKPECDYGLTTGVTYPAPNKRIGEFRIDILRLEKQFEFYTTSGTPAWLSPGNDTNLYNFYVASNRRPYPSISVSIEDKARKVLLFRTTAALKGYDLATLMIQHAENGQQIKSFDARINLETSNRLKINYLIRPGLFEAVKASKLLPPIFLKPSEIINWPVVQSHKSIASEIAEKFKPLFESLDREETAIATELKFKPINLASLLNKLLNNAPEAIKFAIDSVKRSSPVLNQNFLMPLKNFRIMVSDRFGDLYKKVQEVYNESKLKDIVSGPGILYTMSQMIKQRCFDFWHQIRPIIVSNGKYEEMINFFDQIAAKVQWASEYQNSQKAEENMDDDDDKSWLSYPEFLNHKFSYNTITNSETNDVTGSLVMPLIRHHTSLKDLAEALSPNQISASISHFQETAQWYWDKVFSIDTRLPKGQNRAAIVGQQHFVTFNGKVRTISTDCSYLLAKDFIDSSFSVEIQFNKQQGNQIIVEFNNTDRVVLTVDGKVSINGNDAQLPFQVENDENGCHGKSCEFPRKITVVRHDGHSVRVQTFNGLTVECNAFANFCIVTLSDRFRGRTNGLLGRNDGEPYPDLTLPDDLVAHDLNLYLEAWALNPTCAASSNSPVTENISSTIPSYNECQRLFSGQSKCPRVDQHGFLSMCLNSAHLFTEQNPANLHRSVCSSLSAFLSVCPGAGEHPIQCTF